MKKDAILSNDRIYRYVLNRTWDDAKPKAMFVGLNPSTADETEDDPTIRRCIGFAQSWGYGGLIMTNLFTFRATKPKVMKQAHDPIGSDNDKWLKQSACEADLIIAAWGNDGAYLNRVLDVLAILPTTHCINKNKDGSPSHPLFLKSNLTPINFI